MWTDLHSLSFKLFEMVALKTFYIFVCGKTIKK